MDTEQLIRECFIENEEFKKNRSDIERLFSNLPPQLNNVSPIRNTKNLAKKIEDEVASHPADLYRVSPPKPIILVGSKGAGKTTFLNYLFNISFSNDLLKERPYIYIDFRKYTADDLNRINEVILRDAIDTLYNRYPHYELHKLKVLKRIFRREIKHNDEGIWEDDKVKHPERYEEKVNNFLEQKKNDLEFYFIKISEYLLSDRRSRLCVVIDNADQFNMDVQKKAFLFSQSLNIKAKCAVFISLREGYYYKWRHQPPFDAFSSNVYHVTAPPYQQVLEKRIDYALKNLELQGSTLTTLNGNMSVEVKHEAVRDMLLSVRQSLFGQENTKMITFLDQTTFPNIREGLDVFRTFLLSGHTDVKKYILRQQVSPNSPNPIPFWEFVKAVALENRKFYNHQISRVHNLFYPVSDNTFHFLKIKLLKFLTPGVEKVGEKYFKISQITNAFVEAGYKLTSVLDELNELLNYRFIETSDNFSDNEFTADLKENDSICISLKGYYYIRVLIADVTYMEMMLQDTPIFDRDSFEAIRRNFSIPNDNGKQNLHDRINTVELFIKYLEKCEFGETNEMAGIAKDIIREIRVSNFDQEFRRFKESMIDQHRIEKKKL